MSTPSTPDVTGPRSSSTSMTPMMTTFFQWLKQFGVDESTTQLSLWEGCGPEERGLRVNQHWNRRSKRAGNNKPTHDAIDEPTTSESSSSTCSCCQSQMTNSTLPTSTTCACFSTTPCIVAPILTIPAVLLITPAKVRGSSLVKAMLMKDDIARASDSQLLALFLIHQHRLGPEKSKWWPYIATLPKSYTSVEWWSQNELSALQHPELESAASDRREELRECTQLRQWLDRAHPELVAHPKDHPGREDGFLPLHWTDTLSAHVCASADAPCTTSSLCSLPFLSEYQWAWSTISTRSCFLPPVNSSASEVGAQNDTKSVNHLKSASNLSGSTRDSSCLIPYLDMLNHSSAVQVDCRLTTSSSPSGVSTEQYELWMLQPNPLQLCPGQELFISYGAHENKVLLERYGFTLLDNKHEVIKLKLSQVESFLATPHALLTDAQYTQLKGPWPLISSSSSASTSIPSDFFKCSCSKQLDLTGGVPTLPRYSRPLPGFGRTIPNWQLDLLKACGLYEIVDQLQHPLPSISKSTDITFTVPSCHLPFDLSTYLRIRVLTLEEARVAVRELNGGAPPTNHLSSSTSSSSTSTAGPVTGSTLSPAELSTLSTRLLNEDAPFFSLSHRLLTQRLTIELLASYYLMTPGLGETSIQHDLQAYQQRSISVSSSSSSSLEFSYVYQQALILRLTQKRLYHTLFLHALSEL